MSPKLVSLLVGAVLLLSGCSLIPKQPAPTQFIAPTVTLMPVTPLPGSTGVPVESLPTLPPSETPPPTQSGEVQATVELTPTETATQPTPFEPRFAVQPGTPLTVAGFPHPELGCQWMGVGGQVFDTSSKPVTPLVVILKGTIAGQTVDQISVTGSATAWGPGGFEFKIADHPIESSGSLYLQFLNLDGTPISGPVYLTTYGDCDHNSILVNMLEIQAGNVIKRVYFPWIMHGK